MMVGGLSKSLYKTVAKSKLLLKPRQQAHFKRDEVSPWLFSSINKLQMRKATRKLAIIMRGKA